MGNARRVAHEDARGMTQSTPEFLNEATQTWVEIKYHHLVHRETSSSPVDRFAKRCTCSTQVLQRVASRCISLGNRQVLAA